MQIKYFFMKLNDFDAKLLIRALVQSNIKQKLQKNKTVVYINCKKICVVSFDVQLNSRCRKYKIGTGAPGNPKVGKSMTYQ